MNRKMVFYTLGQISITLAALLLLPAGVDLIYGDGKVTSFLITIGISLLLGAFLLVFSKPKDKVIYAKEGFVIVALSWLLMSALGALPFVFSGEIPHYTNAFFETVSGLTTTGASIVEDYSVFTHGVQFWRCFTHWIGGMGVLVFIMAIMPSVSDRSIHIMRAEMAGPVIGKLVPKAKNTAMYLYLIYIGITVLEAVLLICGGLPVYDSTLYAFGTAGTGGFGLSASSIGACTPYAQWVIAVFMMLFGVNFNLYFMLLVRKFRPVFKNRELWVYLSIMAVSTVAIAINTQHLFSSFEETMRTSFFQVSALVTTTGYSTADFNAWPEFSRAIIFILFFLGGCAGSTAGGLKISRVMLLVKMVRSELRHMLHPRSVNIVRMEEKPVENDTLRNVARYFALYILCTVVGFLVISALDQHFNVETNFTAMVSCINNVGPGLGAVGPAGSYAAYTDISKYILSVAMLLGRLEFFPVLLCLSPTTWTKK